MEHAIPIGDEEIDIAVVCTDCYITGQLTTELTVIPSNHTTVNLSTIAHTFASDVVNITDTVVNDVEEIVKNTTEALFDKVPSLDTFETILHNITRPTVDVDFGLSDLVAVPEYQFALTLDELDLFVQTQMTVSGAATYTLNLYTSESPIGLKKGNDLELGIVLTADLILSAYGSLELESGFHLRMDEGLTLTVDLFGRNISEIECHGGSFEFLPVTVNSATVSLQAILRVGVHAGIVMSSKGLTVEGVSIATYSAGLETIAYADVANLTINVAAGSAITGGDKTTSVDSISNVDLTTDTCDGDVFVEGIFNFDIGASAGASLEIGDFLSWGVHPETMLPVFYTTVTQCVGQSSTSTVTATTSPTTKVAARAATTVAPTASSFSSNESRETTVVSSEFVYTAIACRSAGLINCPASLQTTAVTTATSTTTLTVDAATGWEATYPAPTDTTPITKLATFGNNVKTMDLSVSGTPVSYVPPVPTTSSASSSLGTASPTSTPGLTIGGVHLTPKQEHIVIGVTVGAGVPLIIGGIALIV
ncbi:hypothetical protein Sste5346_007345 [Sporothrix stenoceras]|uniref:Uncharacterized protein n=1 Tax=Sporothrix stenoceras TaxID=5173 RepID=A0ABR3YVT3_9PEZI